MIAYLNTFVLQYRVTSIDIFKIVYDFTNISTIVGCYYSINIYNSLYSYNSINDIPKCFI